MSVSSSQTIEERLQAIEDRMEIYQVIACYGYSVDGLNADSVRDCYTEDGVYEIAGLGAYEGREKIANITKDPFHQALVGAGCAHASTLPYVVIDGDKAVATCHTMVITNGEDGFSVWRLSASRINLSRQSGGGWKISHRQVTLLDGNSSGPELLARLRQAPDDVQGLA